MKALVDIRARAIAFLLLGSIGPVWAQPVGAAPDAHSSGVPSALPSSVVTPSSVPELSDAEIASLRREFDLAQKNQLKALAHRQKQEQDEFEKRQKQRLRSWNSEEKTKRRDFFQRNIRGRDRRAYVQDFIKRKEALLQEQKVEKSKRKLAFEARRKEFLQEQAQKKADFESHLEKKIRPPVTLWPFGD